MRGRFWILIVALAAGFLSASSLYADNVRSFSVTFVDAQSSSVVLSTLKSDANACRTAHVCVDAAALQELGRRRFALYESYAASTPRRPAFPDAALLAPPDTRQLAGLWASPASSMPASALWVVTHVDAMPDDAARVANMLQHLGEANMRETGHLRTIAGSQRDHPNHFTLIEIWASRADFETHETDRATRNFRAELAPMIGALYDSRLYRPVE